jgi:integration host factor subunit alpha
VESVFDIIKDELTNGNDVMISGFGKWSVKKKKPRVARNPKTGEEITIDARTVVTFKCAENLRSEMNHAILSDSFKTFLEKEK